MKVVIAPDKFAGTLTAAQAAESIAAGWRSVRPDDELRISPMADGGEGLTQVVADVVDGVTPHTLKVADALGIEREATWLALPDGRALVECAQACGLSALAREQRDPRKTTSYGVGQLLLAARDAGATEIIVGLGGSATNDGGAGMATALGHKLRRDDGNGVKVGGQYIAELASVALAEPLGVPVVAAVDVTNPLLGPEGATAIFGPQKGGTPQVLDELEQAMTVFADIVERDVPGGPWREVPGAGAAGGLGFGLLAFCDGRIRGGADVVAELVGFTDAVAGADVVITGEGKLDHQSEAGKAPTFVRDTAREHGAKVFAVAGQVTDGAGEAFDAWRELGPRGMVAAAELVTERAAELAHTLE